MSEASDVKEAHDTEEAERTPEPAESGPKEVGGPLVLAGLVVKLVTVLFALVLVVHLVIAVLTEDSSDGFPGVIAAVANVLSFGFGKLFDVSSSSLQDLLGYGIPAVIWLVVGVVVDQVLRRMALRRAGA